MLNPEQVASPGQPALVVRWNRMSIVNLRGDGESNAFREVSRAGLGFELPGPLCTAQAGDVLAVWAGPDEWFLMAPPGRALALCASLKQACGTVHHAVTDVSGGYRMARMAGTAAADILAHGCPLDTHPHALGAGSAAASHFFKTPVLHWRDRESMALALLVRSSMADYVRLMLARCAAECGLEMHEEA